MPMVKVRTGRSDWVCISATIVLLSIPAERNAPSGTSASDWPRMASRSLRSSSCDASEKLPSKGCSLPRSAASRMDQ